MILGGGVAVCLLLSVHRVVIFTIAQLSCCLIQVQANTEGYEIQGEGAGEYEYAAAGDAANGDASGAVAKFR